MQRCLRACAARAVWRSCVLPGATAWPSASPLPLLRAMATQASVETFANAEVPAAAAATASSAAAAPAVAPAAAPRGKRSAMLKKNQKEKRARRPGDEEPGEGAQRIRVVSCAEMEWSQMKNTFPTAHHVDHNQHQLVYFVDETDPEVCSFLFPYGVGVFWGVGQEEMQAKVGLMNENGIPVPRLPKVDFSHIRDDDFFYYSHQPPPEPVDGADPPARQPLCVRDGPRFTLHDPGVRLKLVLSHAFAQSTRLDILEQQFRRISSVTKGIAPKQRETGEVPVDWERGDIVATMGALEAIRRELEIDGSICNVHDLFWDEDELSDLLDATRLYLDIEDRAEHLLAQIELVRSQLANLLTEINALQSTTDHHRAIRREWYIILLIFYEAVVIKVADVGEAIAHLFGL